MNNKPAGNVNPTSSYDRQTQGPNDVRFDKGGKRVPPRERPFMDWNRPGHFYGHHPHYFGYRVHYLPHYRRYHYWGIDYTVLAVVACENFRKLVGVIEAYGLAPVSSREIREMEHIFNLPH